MKTIEDIFTEDVCYIYYPVIVDGKSFYQIRDFKGLPISLIETREAAIETVRMHGLIPMSMH